MDYKNEIDTLLKHREELLKSMETVSKTSELYPKVLKSLEEVDVRLMEWRKLESAAEKMAIDYVLNDKKLDLEATKVDNEFQTKRREAENEMAKTNVDEELRIRKIELEEKQSDRNYELEKMRIESEERIRCHEIEANANAKVAESKWNNALSVMGLIVKGLVVPGLGAVTTLIISGLDEEHVVSQKLLGFAKDHIKSPDRI